MGFLPVLLMLSLFSTVACGGSDTAPETQVTLELDIDDPRLEAAMTEVEVSLWREDEQWVKASSVTLESAQLVMPLRIPIIPRSAGAVDKSFEVIVDVMAGPRRIGQGRVLSAYLVNQRRILPLVIRSCADQDSRIDCADNDCHGEGCTTCGGGETCATVVVADPENLLAEEPRGGSEAGAAAEPDGLPGPIETLEPENPGTPGPAPSTGAAAEVCTEPSGEVCDGTDNDCDGQADNGAGMMCVRGMREPCTFSSGTCSVMGERECNSICSFSACEAPAEALCDGQDDNCNGVVDEQLLEIGSPLPLAGYDGELWGVSLATSPTNSGAMGGYFAAFIARAANASRSRLTGLRISPEGRLLGAPIVFSEDAGKGVAVGWGGDQWAVVYNQGVDQGGWSHGLTYVTVDPSSGALGAARPLGGGGPNVYVRMTGSSPPVVAWEEDGGILAAALDEAAEVKTLLRAPTQKVPGVSYHYFALASVEDGKEWGLVASGSDDSSDADYSYPVRYLSFDANLDVTRNVLLTQTPIMWGIWELSYAAETRQLVSHFSDNGVPHHASLGLDGSQFSLSDETTAWSGSLVSDPNGYASIGGNAIYRFRTSGEELEAYASDESFGREVAAVSTAEGAAARYAVAGGHEGALRMFFIGCK